MLELLDLWTALKFVWNGIPSLRSLKKTQLSKFPHRHDRKKKVNILNLQNLFLKSEGAGGVGQQKRHLGNFLEE